MTRTTEPSSPAGKPRGTKGRARATSNIGSANLDEPLPGESPSNAIERSTFRPGGEMSSAELGAPRMEAPPESASSAALPPDVRERFEERYEAIARAAYYRAERRGFEPGRELDDWLDAERELTDEQSPTGIR